MHYCGAPNTEPSYRRFSPTCHNWIPDDQERCWAHGGPLRPQDIRERQMERRRELDSHYRAEKKREAYIRYHNRLDAQQRQIKVAQWMLTGGGGAAFEDFQRVTMLANDASHG